MRISKYFSQQKILSRRETEGYILAGKIAVNGEIVHDLGRQIDPEKDTVEIVGEKEEKTTVLYYKPPGISSSKIPEEGTNIFDLLPQFNDLHAVGRLDKESEGLILLSDDGVITNVVTGEDHTIEKEYIVTVREVISQTQINALQKTMHLEDGPTLPAKAEKLDDHTFSITLKEGRNHQIRRMANQVRLTITGLKRVRIGVLDDEGLGVGDFRYLTEAEVTAVKKWVNFHVGTLYPCNRPMLLLNLQVPFYQRLRGS